MLKTSYALSWQPSWVLSSGASLLPQLPLNATEVSIGDSITNHAGVRNIADWRRAFLGGKTYAPPESNQGYSGYKTDQLIALQSTGLALNPLVYYILAGTNDIVIGGYPASTTIANLQTIIDNAKATSSVEMIVIRTIMTRSGSNAFTAPQEATRNTINDWIRSISDPQVIVIDLDLSGWDPTIHASDGLHPNGLGAALLGKYEAQALQSRFAVGSVLDTLSGNLLPNPTFAGTGGLYANLGTHDVPDDWRVRNYTGVTCNVTKGTDADGFTSVIISLSGMTPSSGYVQMDAPSITYSGASGDVFEILANIDITGGANLGDYLIRSDGCVDLGSGSDVSAPLNQDISGIFRSTASTLTATDTSNSPSFTFYFASGVAIDMQIEISRPIWRKVN